MIDKVRFQVIDNTRLSCFHYDLQTASFQRRRISFGYFHIMCFRTCPVRPHNFPILFKKRASYTIVWYNRPKGFKNVIEHIIQKHSGVNMSRDICESSGFFKSFIQRTGKIFKGRSEFGHII